MSKKHIITVQGSPVHLKWSPSGGSDGEAERESALAEQVLEVVSELLKDVESKAKNLAPHQAVLIALVDFAEAQLRKSHELESRLIALQTRVLNWHATFSGGSEGNPLPSEKPEQDANLALIPAAMNESGEILSDEASS